MNILLLTYQGDISGATNSISYLAKGLALRGHKVYLGCRKEALLWQLLKDTPVQLIAMKFKGRLDFKNIRHIRDVVNEYGIEIINAQSSLDRYTSIIAKWRYGLKAKLIHTRRQTPESIGGKLQNWFYTKGTDQIVAVSDELKATLVKMGLPENHISVIYNGTPKERYANIKEKEIDLLRSKLEIDKVDVVIGCVSRRKKQEQLIEVLPFLDPNIKVVFVGIEPNSLDTLVDKFKVQQKIIYAGTVNNVEVLNYYKLFAVSILPSTMDGFGLVLVEAMALGVPVVATRAEGIKNVVEENLSGLLFEDGNIKELEQKIKLALYNSDLRSTLINNGLIRALETFSIEKTIENYERLFIKLLTQKF